MRTPDHLDLPTGGAPDSLKQRRKRRVTHVLSLRDNWLYRAAFSRQITPENPPPTSVSPPPYDPSSPIDAKPDRRRKELRLVLHQGETSSRLPRSMNSMG